MMGKNTQSDFLKAGLKEKPNGFEIIHDEGLVEFPTNIFPEHIEKLLIDLERVAGFETTVTGAGILFAISILIGNKNPIKIKNTWKDTPNLWLAIVGDRGTGKSPALSFVLAPLEEDEVRFGEAFSSELNDWNATSDEANKRGKRPIRKQRLTSDTTVEALIIAMNDNGGVIGIVSDELSGFFSSMNQYKKSGSDAATYLGMWNGNKIIKNRVRHDPLTVNNPFLSVIGGIQPGVIKTIATEINMMSGMFDRWLFAVMLGEKRNFTLEDINANMIDEYNDYIDSIKGLVEQDEMCWGPDANAQFEAFMNNIDDYRNEDDVSDLLSAYLAKLQIYLLRLCGVVAAINGSLTIGILDVEKAFKIVTYFIQTAKSTFIILENQETMAALFKKESANTKKKKILAILEYMPQLSSKEICKEVGCDVRYVNRVKEERDDRKK